MKKIKLLNVFLSLVLGISIISISSVSAAETIKVGIIGRLAVPWPLMLGR